MTTLLIVLLIAAAGAVAWSAVERRFDPAHLSDRLLHQSREEAAPD
jgi:hypothetical protein